MVDQEISQHRAAEGPADERCHHRVSQGRAPLSQNRKCERFWTLPASRHALLTRPQLPQTGAWDEPTIKTDRPHPHRMAEFCNTIPPKDGVIGRPACG